MQSPLPLALAALMCPLASAQCLDDTFEAGTNLDNWVAWDAQYSSISTGGGHPYEQLVLNNLIGSTTCQYVFVEPTGIAPYAHTGARRSRLEALRLPDADGGDRRPSGVVRRQRVQHGDQRPGVEHCDSGRRSSPRRWRSRSSSSASFPLPCAAWSHYCDVRSNGRSTTSVD